MLDGDHIWKDFIVSQPLLAIITNQQWSNVYDNSSDFQVIFVFYFINR